MSFVALGSEGTLAEQHLTSVPPEDAARYLGVWFSFCGPRGGSHGRWTAQVSKLHCTIQSFFKTCDGLSPPSHNLAKSSAANCTAASWSLSKVEFLNGASSRKHVASQHDGCSPHLASAHAVRSSEYHRPCPHINGTRWTRSPWRHGSCPYMWKPSSPLYWRASPPTYRQRATRTRIGFSHRHLARAPAFSNQALLATWTTTRMPPNRGLPSATQLPPLNAPPRFAPEPSPCTAWPSMWDEQGDSRGLRV